MQTSYSRRLGKKFTRWKQSKNNNTHSKTNTTEIQNLKMFKGGDDFPQKTGITGTSAQPMEINDTLGEIVQQKKYSVTNVKEKFIIEKMLL